MTVDWITYAQSLTDKPVKGMLTGPVTILAWSFVRDDQPLAETAAQVALAIRDETVDLQAAGIAIIQVDEPALRELLPLRRRTRTPTCVGRSTRSGWRRPVSRTRRRSTRTCATRSSARSSGRSRDLDADVTSIEAARSHMEVLDDLNAGGLRQQRRARVSTTSTRRGCPASPRSTESLRAALKAVPAERLWVNPDCGLKTRTTDEVTASLQHLVAAAKQIRSTCA